MKGTEMADFTQNPDPLLLNYVDKIIGGFMIFDVLA